MSASIERFLSCGEKQAVHLSDLCRLTGVSETSIKAAIRRERLKGVPILSGISGYWLADGEHEKHCFVRMMQMQGRSRLEVAEAVGAAVIEGVEDG